MKGFLWNWKVALVVSSMIYAPVHILSAQGVSPSNYKIEYLDVNTGLSNNYVTKVISDQKGIMWFAAEGGMNRFSGSSYRILKPDDNYSGLENENIETLLTDKDGFIWVGTKSGGVSRYSPSEDKFRSYNHLVKRPNSPEKVRVAEIIQSHDGQIWVTTYENGVYVIDVENDKLLTHYPIGETAAAEVDSFGNLWFGNYSRIQKFDPSEGRLISFNVPARGINDLYYDKGREILWVAAQNGLFLFDPIDLRSEELSLARSELTAVTTVEIDNEDRLWVGTWGDGLFVSDVHGRELYPFSLLPKHLNNSNYSVILDIHVDDHMILWISTGHGGVVKMTPSHFFSYVGNTVKNPIGLGDNNIRAIYNDKNGYLWLGTWGKGIFYSSDEGKSFKQVPGLFEQKINCLLPINDYLYIGSLTGLHRISLYNPNQEPELVKRMRQVTTLFVDPHEQLWIGTHETGILKADMKSDHPFDEVDSLQKNVRDQSRRISAISMDSNEDIWIGTYDGLFHYSRQSNNLKEVTDSLTLEFPSVIILSIYNQGNKMWVGFSGGLIEFTINKAGLEFSAKYDKSNGLFNDYITGITMDSQNNLWVSHPAGIAMLDKNSQMFINYSFKEDIQLSTLNIGAVFNDGHKLYFGGANGMVVFDPSTLQNTLTAPDLVFNSLKIDNIEVDVGKEINGRVLLSQNLAYQKQLDLTNKEKVIAISLIANDYLGLDNITYYYRLNGFQDNWINNGADNEISLTGLSPGTYELEVKATRGLDQFGETNTLTLQMLPPPWASAWAFALYVLIIFGIILAIRQLAIKQTRLNANLELARMNQKKEHEITEGKIKFFTNISHELRTPLTLIMSPISEIIEESGSDEKVQKKLGYVQKNAQKLLSLINQLLDFRKAEQGLLNLHKSTGDFVLFARYVFDIYKDYAERKRIRYFFEVEEERMMMTFDRSKMEIVLDNLISNAFKYTDEGDSVEVKLSHKGERCEIRIKDTGRGIPEEYLGKIFDWYFQVGRYDSGKSGGTGIGLSLSKRLIELHGGTIQVTSQPDHGTEFIVSIPYNIENLTDDPLSSLDLEENLELQIREGSKREPGPDDERPTLLVIDDNEDICNYIQEMFEEEYYVLSASNGEEGLVQAKREIPDIIISDVMMPGISGIDLCKKLKSDIGTSHIPVILLTARTAAEFEVMGLDSGADDYIRKPFTPSVIKSKVKSILANREKIWSHYSNKFRFEPEAEPKELNYEEKFVENAISIVERNIDNSAFDIQVLGDELCMSQSTLYRKIKSLTGFTTTGFVRSVRIKKAAQLLYTENLNLTDVAYTVGFKDYKYFKQCFKERMGISPGEYREMILNKKDD